MPKKPFYNFIILIILFIISQSSILSAQYFVIGFTIFLFVLNLTSGKPINRKIIYISVIWMAINFLAIVFISKSFILPRIFYYLISLILFPYLALNLVGESFWFRFEKILYTLTLISIPAFILNMLIPDFFNSLTSVFRPLTSKVFYLHDPKGTYWTSLVYVNAIRDKFYFRNSGFMWEPGAYAMILIWAIIFNWQTKTKTLNSRILTYIIVLLSTFSTAGYLALFNILVANYSRKFSLSNVVILLVVNIVFVNYIYKLDFVGKEISQYIEAYNEQYLSYSDTYQAIKVNRFEIVEYDVKKTLSYPIGYGVVSKEDYSGESDIVGVNGLSALLVMWGIPVFIFLIVLMKRYLSYFNYNNTNKLTIYLFLTGLLMMFFSNPVSRNVFVYLIFLTPIFFKNKQVPVAKL
jgi:hypothetical protein